LTPSPPSPQQQEAKALAERLRGQGHGRDPHNTAVGRGCASCEAIEFLTALSAPVEQQERGVSEAQMQALRSAIKAFDTASVWDHWVGRAQERAEQAFVAALAASKAERGSE
jgi:hypothetical protein